MSTIIDLHLEAQKSRYLFDHIHQIFNHQRGSSLGDGIQELGINDKDKKSEQVKVINFSDNDSEEIIVEFHRVENLDDKAIDLFVSIIDENIGVFYEQVSGSNWKEDKYEEMRESGVIYGYIKSNDNDQLLGFLSFKLCTDNDKDVLYLYEIQILEKYRNLKIGSKLMNFLHYIPNYLNRDLNYMKISSNVKIFGNSLTVFSANIKAFNFYKRLGYYFSDHSPSDRVFRSGVVVKPTYYIMIRPLLL